MAERGAGLPKTFLDPNTAFGAPTVSFGGFNASSSWFGPLNPLNPIAPKEVTGRQFDLQPGYNIISKPRQQEQISFAYLRNLADGYDVLRTIIETRKDQVDRMNWSVRAKKGKKVSDARLQAVTTFFMRTDGEHTFNQWLRMILEDLFVIDAPTIWKQRTRGGDLYALRPLDGGSIKRVIDDWGRTPMPYTDENGVLVIPPAFQQVFKGYPAVDYTVNDLVYAPRNIRTNRVYGYSPVEQILMTVNIALRRQLGQLEYYTAGNIPEALIGVPDTWTPDQIKQFQDYWDIYFTGDAAARRKAKFVPGGVAKTFIQTKEPELKNVFDEWLVKVCCYAFSVSSQAFSSQVNRATANAQKEQAEEEGLSPILQWVKHLIDPIINIDLKEPDIEFIWNEDIQIAPVDEANILKTYTGAALLTINEARDRLGMDPSNVPEADELGFATATGFVYLDETKKPEPLEPSLGNGPVKTTPKVKKAPAEVTKLDELFDLVKEHVGHDVDDQPRDNKGRFASSGGPSAREQRKAAKPRKDDGIARDEHGRFVPGKITKEGAKKIARKVGAKVALASVLAATGAAVVHFTRNSEIGSTIGDAVSEAASKLTKTLLVSSAETMLATALRAAGSDADFAKKAASVVRKTIMGVLDALAEKTSTDTELGISDEDMDEVMRIARTILPNFSEQVCDALIANLESHGTDMSSMTDQIESDRQEFVDAVSELGKSASPFDLQKGLVKQPLLKYNRPATKKATKAAFDTIYNAFQAAKKSAATLIRDGLTPLLENVGKAAKTTSSDAITLAAALDLSAIEDIVVDLGDDLGIVSSDAAHRTIIQIGASTTDELVSQTSDNAAQWAKDHAAELLGKKILSDGTVVDDPGLDYTITESTRNLVRDVISKGIRDGLTLDQIVQNVEDIGFSEERAQSIAEDEVAIANSAGTLQGYSDAASAGVEVLKGWLTVGDEKVDDEICGPNEEEGPIPLDQPFQSGHMTPIGHPRCRCSLVAYVGSTTQTEE